MTENEKTAREEELRRHRCCFIGHRMEKLYETEDQVLLWLEKEIENAIQNGFTTFITGMSMGADILGGEAVLKMKASHPNVHLIAATPYPSFAARWKDDWKLRYDRLWAAADLRVVVCPAFQNDAFQKRSEWIADHSSAVIAYYNGEEGGAKKTLRYAEALGLKITVYESHPHEDKEKQ